MMPTALRTTLAMVAGAMAGAADPWWVIGSAAVVLHGADGVDVGDVDVLLSERDAPAVLALLGVADITGGGTALFRSAVFGRWEGPPLTVEFMAGFRFCGADGWRVVWPATRELVMVDGCAMFVPERAELAAMLLGFGWAKDLARAKALSPSGERGRAMTVVVAGRLRGFRLRPRL